MGGDETSFARTPGFCGKDNHPNAVLIKLNQIGSVTETLDT